MTQRTTASFFYLYPNGDPYCRIDRKEPGRNGNAKDFYPYLALPGGGYATKAGLVKGERPPLYHADRLNAAKLCFIVEGEGKCDELQERMGDVAVVTVVPGGASAPLTDDHVAQLATVASVVVIADADKSGRDCVAKRARKIADTYPGKTVRTVDLFPERDDGSDSKEFFAEGRTAPDLIAIVERAKPVWPVAKPPRNDESEPNGDGDDEKQTAAQILVNLVLGAGVEFVHDDTEVAYALVPHNGSCAVYLVRSSAFSALLRKRFYAAMGKPPHATALSDARYLMEAFALHDGRCVRIHLRYHDEPDAICIDLGDAQRRMVRVTGQGWSVEPHGAILFRRPSNMLALPEPVPGGSLGELQAFVNLDEENFLKFAMATVCAMRESGPFPVQMFTGEQGSAKSTAAKLQKVLVDPGVPDVRIGVRDTHELMIAASNAHQVCFDNQSASTMTQKLSDAFCCLSTGGGFSARALYTDDEEKIFEAKRPIILTSIEDVAGRPELADRAFVIRFGAIRGSYRTEKELLAGFEEARPRIFGALLDRLAVGLKNYAQVAQSERVRHRMADAYLWTLSVFDDRDAVRKAWASNRGKAVSAALDASPIAEPLVAILTERLSSSETWETTARELLLGLNEKTATDKQREQEWPRSSQSLTNKLARIAPHLRAVGFKYEAMDAPVGGRARRLTFQRVPLDKGLKSSDSSDAHDGPASEASRKSELSRVLSANGVCETCGEPAHETGFDDDDQARLRLALRFFAGEAVEGWDLTRRQAECALGMFDDDH
jgi:hypothetical protein